MGQTPAPMDAIDARFDSLSQILVEFDELHATIVTEADTRLKVIDRILADVLGWPLTSTQVEERAGEGYIDYCLNVSGASRLIVEAKKDAFSFGLENRQSAQAFKLDGAVFNAAAKDAIKQAITYNAFKNAELACVTNGSEWIIFRGNRLGDGRNTLDGKGFVFSSLRAVANNFRIFHDLMAQDAVRDLRFRALFQEAEGIALRDLSFMQPVRGPESRTLVPRSSMAIDLDSVMSSFFRRLNGEQDDDMVLNCFVVTPESKTAEQKLSRIAEDLVQRMRDVNTDTGGQLVALIEAVQKQQRHRFVLLVGNKGAGKSTFVERFFRFIIPREIADGLILIHINVAHSDGDRNKIVDWLNTAALEECERVLFADRGPSWEEYIGAMFFDEYKRWSEGSMRPLYESDKTQFRIEFGRHIENVRRERPHEFIRRLLRHIVHSRKQVPCLIFDNTDHFTIEFQESVFQYARSLYESELSLVLVPITDRTSWQLSKQGALQSFESEALFLPVPNPQRVIERRIAYLTDKIALGKERQSQDYFFGRGIKLDISNLSAFAASLHRIFVHTRSTSDWIGGLVNYDIRRLLEQTRDVIASPHLPLEDLLKAHLTGSTLAVEEWRIKHAIIKRRYDIYPVGDHPFLQNIFAMTVECVTTPLLGLRILQFLRDAQSRVNDEGRSFVQVSAIYEHCNAMGIQGRPVTLWLDAMLKAGLVLEYDPTITDVDQLSKVEISAAGKVHLIWGTTDETYIQTMRDVSPLRDRHVFDEIVDCLRNDYRRNWNKAVVVFIDYLLDEDSRYIQIPQHSLYHGQQAVGARLVKVKNLLLPPGQRQYPKYIPRNAVKGRSASTQD